ncbi:MAG: 16S rRNA (uracil(1498)-N(3))-methyltransferase [Lachnospiraceae bacterium]|nr:16S rRNA (uracil(1498)-N(3))-methyltransferase [Lachnospiraceae bacterium]
MHHFFADPADITDRDIYIRGEDHNHIKNVLRMKPGETLSVSDGISGNEYRCHIEDFEGGAVHCRLDFIKEADTELPAEILVFQCIPKSDKMELVIQKAVELGAAEIIPVASKRCIAHYEGRKAEDRVRRWNQIAKGAAKQSMRARIPEVRKIMGFEEALSYAGKCDVRIIPYELAEGFNTTREIIDPLKEGSSIAVFVGPEGGFAEEEIEKAKEHDIVPVTLGHRILRTETAAMVVLSWLIYRFEK